MSGHGRAVESLGTKLRELMQKFLTALEQVSLMRDLNGAVKEGLDGIHYATMVAVGFHGRRGLLVMTNAGHPPALWYWAHRGEWEWLNHTVQGAGIGDQWHSPRPVAERFLRPDDRQAGPGDLILLYSDGISEATNSDGEELGRERLMAVVRTLSSSSAETSELNWSTLSMFRGNSTPEDDETIIVLQAFPEQSS